LHLKEPEDAQIKPADGVQHINLIDAQRSMQQLVSSEPIVIKPEVSIATSLLDAHNSGNTHPRFTLHASMSDDGMVGTESIASEFFVHVMEPLQAVTPTTTISEFDGPARPVGELDYTILVTDVELEDEGTISIIAVNKKSGEVQGIVHKGEKTIKISQGNGEMVSQLKTLGTAALNSCEVLNVTITFYQT
jgi:hypothetical protein